MQRELATRREVLRTGSAVAGAALLTSLSGCQGALDDEPTDDSPRESQLPALVPADTTFLTHIDVETILTDASIRSSLADVLEDAESEDVPATVDELFSEMAEEVGVNPSELSELLVFGTFDEEAFGALAWADWTDDEFRTFLEEELRGDLEEDSYGDHTLYEDGGTAAATVLDDGLFLLGTRPLVETVIDVWNDEGEALTGDLATAFEDTSPGPIRFAAEAPPQFSAAAGMDPDFEPFQDVTRLSGGLAFEGEDRVALLHLRTPSEGDAEEIETAAIEFLDILEAEFEADEQAAGPELAVFEEAIDHVDVRTDDRDAIIEYRADADEFAEFVAATFGMFFFGVGQDSDRGRAEPDIAPNVAFEFDYEPVEDDAGVLTIVHVGGDTVPANELVVEGEGFADIEGAAQISRGPWQGATSDGDVQAGHSVTVGVSEPYFVRLIWEGESGDMSVLAEFQG